MTPSLSLPKKCMVRPALCNSRLRKAMPANTAITSTAEAKSIFTACCGFTSTICMLKAEARRLSPQRNYTSATTPHSNPSSRTTAAPSPCRTALSSEAALHRGASGSPLSRTPARLNSAAPSARAHTRAISASSSPAARSMRRETSRSTSRPPRFRPVNSSCSTLTPARR